MSTLDQAEAIARCIAGMKDEQMYRELLKSSDVPDGLHDGLALYLARGIPPGSFLMAVLSNQLIQAVNRADDKCSAGLVALVQWLYHAAPAVSWGSESNVNEWITTRARTRTQVPA